jgi:5-methylcytosine-specific restriction endonuclease McrA
VRSLQLPAVTTSQVLSMCLTAIGDPDLKARLEAIGPSLNAAAVTYHAGANAAALHLMPRVTSVGTVSKDELIALYSYHLSSSSGTARPVYDQIKNAVPNKKCPLCGIGTVAALDHHLPKAKYPDLAIVPVNLVPSCHSCNDTKKARFPKNAGEQTLHPYYDSRLLAQQWIKATLDYGSPPAIIFSASPPPSWSAVDQTRVERHFTVCGLAVAFTANANDELGPLKARLEMVESRGGQPAVQAHLAEGARSYAQRPNSWQLAMYQTLAADSWFTAGGFHSIP